jgi:hypothetical protein
LADSDETMSYSDMSIGSPHISYKYDQTMDVSMPELEADRDGLTLRLSPRGQYQVSFRGFKNIYFWEF